MVVMKTEQLDSFPFKTIGSGGAQNFLNFMQFLESFAKILGWRPSYGKSWIRPWLAGPNHTSYYIDLTVEW